MSLAEVQDSAPKQADFREDAPKRIVLRDLVTVLEIAHRVGVAVVTVRKWRERYPETFPKPVVSYAMGPLWYWPEVERWLKKPRPAGRIGTWDKIQNSRPT